MQQLAKGQQVPGAGRAVGDPVVGRQAGHHERAYAEHAVGGPRPIRDRAEADQRDLRRVDDANDGLDALLAQVRHGDRRVGQFGGAQPACARTRDQILEGRHQIAERELIGVVDRGRDQTATAQGNRELPVAERIVPAALLLKAAAQALRTVPALNGHFVDGGFRQSDLIPGTASMRVGVVTRGPRV